MVYFGFQASLLLLFFSYRVYLFFFALFFGFVLSSIGLEPLILLVLFFSYRVYLKGFLVVFRICAVFYRS